MEVYTPGISHLLSNMEVRHIGGGGDIHNNGSDHHALYPITFTRTGPINPPDINPDGFSVGPG